MLKIIFNSSNNDYSKENIDADKAAQGIANKTMEDSRKK